MEVWYGSDQGLKGEVDKQFGTPVKWDIPILDGYKSIFLKNYSPNPGFYKGFFGLMNLGIANRLRRLPSKSIVIVNAWYPFSAIYTIFCSKLLGHITCLRAETPLNQELARGKGKLLLRKLFLKYLLFKLVDKFLYIGDQNKNLYNYFGVPEGKLLFAPYSVNNEFFQKQNAILTKSELRNKFGIDSKSILILYSGKLIGKKNPMDLLKAYSKLKTHENIHLIFMGDGELKTEIKEFIQLNSLKNVTITGFINQTKISEYYKIADIFVMCSGIGETWGLSINEAMNFGLPIISSDMVGCSTNLVKENGFLYPLNNIEKLRDSLEIMISNEKIRENMGAKSLELINNYSYNQIIEAIEYIK